MCAERQRPGFTCLYRATYGEPIHSGYTNTCYYRVLRRRQYRAYRINVDTGWCYRVRRCAKAEPIAFCWFVKRRSESGNHSSPRFSFSLAYTR